MKKTTSTALIHETGKRTEVEKIKKAKTAERDVSKAISEASEETAKMLTRKGYDYVVEPLSYLADERVGELEKRLEKGNFDLQTMILYYSDGITSGTNIVSVKERMAGLKERYPDLDVSEESLGGRSFLGVQEEVLQGVERVLANKAGVDDSSLLPQEIIKGIAERINRSSR